MVLIVGISGAAILLLFFVLAQFGKLKSESLWYDGGNLVGAALLALYAYLIDSLPFLIIETIWALVSLRDVIKYFKK